MESTLLSVPSGMTLAFVLQCPQQKFILSMAKKVNVRFLRKGGTERFHRGHGLFLLLAVVTGFYMLKVPNW